MLSIIENAAFTFSARGAGRANRGRFPANEVNFAERPLAGIYAKLTKLRDNKVVAMVWFAETQVIILSSRDFFQKKCAMDYF